MSAFAAGWLLAFSLNFFSEGREVEGALTFVIGILNLYAMRRP